jgi:menaquinol-cytochrome c reductase iron-sulfur subunit
MADEQPGELTRRKFLWTVVVGGVAAVTVAVGAPLVGYFMTPAFTKPTKRTVPVANTSDITVGTPTFIAYEESARDAWVTTTQSKGVWIVTQNGKDFTVFDPHCTHLGCGYKWDAAKNNFQCPCHGGVFDINGNVLAGPPPRPLDKVAFTIENGSIQVVTSA